MQLAHANRLRIKPVVEICPISRLLHATEYDEADFAEHGYRGEDQPQTGASPRNRVPPIAAMMGTSFYTERLEPP